MMNGLNYITDERGRRKAILLDLTVFKKENIQASEVLEELAELQELIDQAAHDNKKESNWDMVKEKLKNLKNTGL
jgi:macrodomain Ter protein organizer (MatP/YcbG family)